MHLLYLLPYTKNGKCLSASVHGDNAVSKEASDSRATSLLYASTSRVMLLLFSVAHVYSSHQGPRAGKLTFLLFSDTLVHTQVSNASAHFLRQIICDKCFLLDVVKFLSRVVLSHERIPNVTPFLFNKKARTPVFWHMNLYP